MPQPPQHQPGAAPPKRRKRRFLRRAAIVLFLAFVVITVGFGPSRISHFALDDAALVKFERGERRLRADLGLSMPGSPDLTRLPQRLTENGVALGAPIFMRIFKREFELELWMQRDGIFHRFATYPICMWSGGLGPKLREGDGQSPEGYYTVGKSQLNPNSSYHRSFNLGYPNAYDRAHGRTGSFLMVHGACASVGCFAMTDAQIDEIWQIVTAALDKGQARFQVQVLPFRMTEDVMAKHADHPDVDLWRDLKAGSDLFEATLTPPRISVCNQRYRVEPGAKGTLGDAEVSPACPG